MTRWKNCELPPGDSEQDATSSAEGSNDARSKGPEPTGLREPLVYLHAMSAQRFRGFGLEQRDDEIPGLDVTAHNLRHGEGGEPAEPTAEEHGRQGAIVSPELTGGGYNSGLEQEDAQRCHTYVAHGGATYYVETIDRGPVNPKVETLVFIGGTLLHAKRIAYTEMLQGDSSQEVVRKLMDEQHQGVIGEVRAGKFPRVTQSR